MTDFVARVSAAKRWLVGARTFRPARKAIFLESALQSWGQRGIYHAWTAMRTSRSVALGAVMAAVVATSVSGNTRLDYVAQRARWTVLGWTGTAYVTCGITNTLAVNQLESAEFSATFRRPIACA